MEQAISEKDLDIKIKILAKKINDEHRDDRDWETFCF